MAKKEYPDEFQLFLELIRNLRNSTLRYLRIDSSNDKDKEKEKNEK